MKAKCPSHCHKKYKTSGILKYGSYYRKSDRRKIHRFKCAHCGRHFSQATNSSCFGQNKRHLNHQIYLRLASGMSQRRIARQLKIQLKTVARKLEFLGDQLRHKNLLYRRQYGLVHEIQFDDMETFEHTKLKPLSITLMVEKHTRYILGFEISKMPAKGLLAKKSLKKYGYRKDQRAESRDRLMRRVKGNVFNHATIESDKNPHYPKDVKTHFPKSLHITFEGQRGAITGQGELKKIKFDPLFSLNHTCAMFRANVNRLIRKTWCTTKKMQSLANHLEIYTHYHNHTLIAA